MIKVSEQAKSEVTKLMEADGYNISIDYVRVGVKSGGCSGLSYDLNFDNSINKLNELSDKYGKWIAEMKNISKTLTSASNKVTASKNINICKKQSRTI